MFSRLENRLFLKTFCFLLLRCKDNTKTSNYVLKHGYNPYYLTINKRLFLKLTDINKYCCKNDTNNLTYKCSLTKLAEALKSC